MIDLLKARKYCFIVSTVLIGIGLASVFVPPGLGWGIEFSSGASMTVGLPGEVTNQQIRGVMSELGYEDSIVQKSGEEFFIRIRAHEDLASQRIDLQTGLEERFSSVDPFQFEAVSPIVARETVRGALVAVIVASIGILLYIAWAFRNVSHPFRYGVCANIALVHDVLLVIGGYSILSRFVPLDVSTMFLVGLLTVVGYSVNDTIVVFDRIRENLGRDVSRSFRVVVNLSLIETLGRSVITSLTTLFTILTLLLIGGASLQPLLLVLLLGVISGTYSSIFIASQFLVMWEERVSGQGAGQTTIGSRA